MTATGRDRPSLAELTEAQRAEAAARFAVLRPHLEDGVPLARAARERGVPIRTAEWWLARYRDGGLVGLARPRRSDSGRWRAAAEVVELIEGMALDPAAPLGRRDPPARCGDRRRAGLARAVAPKRPSDRGSARPGHGHARP